MIYFFKRKKERATPFPVRAFNAANNFRFNVLNINFPNGATAIFQFMITRRIIKPGKKAPGNRAWDYGQRCAEPIFQQIDETRINRLFGCVCNYTACTFTFEHCLTSSARCFLGSPSINADTRAPEKVFAGGTITCGQE